MMKQLNYATSIKCLEETFNWIQVTRIIPLLPDSTGRHNRKEVVQVMHKDRVTETIIETVLHKTPREGKAVKSPVLTEAEVINMILKKITRRFPGYFFINYF